MCSSTYQHSNWERDSVTNATSQQCCQEVPEDWLLATYTWREHGWFHVISVSWHFQNHMHTIHTMSHSEPGITNEKKKRRKFLGGSESIPHPPSPRTILKFKLKSVQFEAFWRQIWRNLAHKFITNISFVPSICIHRSIISILIGKEKVCLSIFFPWIICFSAISYFHFRENPRFRAKFQALNTQ